MDIPNYQSQPQNNPNQSDEDMMVDLMNFASEVIHRSLSGPIKTESPAYVQKRTTENEDGSLTYESTIFSQEGLASHLESQATRELQMQNFLLQQQLQEQNAMLQQMNLATMSQQMMFNQYLQVTQHNFNRMLEETVNHSRHQIESFVGKFADLIQAPRVSHQNSIPVQIESTIPEAEYTIVSERDEEDILFEALPEPQGFDKTVQKSPKGGTVMQETVAQCADVETSAGDGIEAQSSVIESVSEVEVEAIGSNPYADPIIGPTPNSPPGWIAVEYSEKKSVTSEVYRNTNNARYKDLTTDENVDCMESELQETLKLDVYKHKIPEGFVQNTPNGKLFWEAFDIPFDPQWKKIVATCMEGLTEAPFCIVRLLVNETNRSQDYITLYVNDTSFSKYFSDARANLPQGTTASSIPPIAYAGELSRNPAYMHMFSAFAYAWQLNRTSKFVICEQIADHRRDGHKNLLLSSYEPKTEINIQYNIFKGTQPFVYTNYRVPSFICQETPDRGFIISKR